MDPIIWAAAIAGGVSVIGNVTTGVVAWLGRDAQREQMQTAKTVELAKVNADAERIREERREAARRDRRELYGRAMVAIAQLDQYGSQDLAPADDDYSAAFRAVEQLHSEVLLTGTRPVEDGMSEVLDALLSIGAVMHRFPGGPGEQFHAAYRENRRGDALTAARGALIAAMHDDVTAPHLPD